MLSRMLAQGISRGSWKHTLTRSGAGSKSMAPSVGRSRPPSMRKIVVLPQPDGPSSATKAPGSTVRLRSRTACTAPKWRCTWERRMPAAVMVQ